jgi:hypothetical protein
MSDAEPVAIAAPRTAAERVERATHDMNNALAVLTMCLEFLAGTTIGEARQAVDDASSATHLLARAVSGIRCGRWDDASASEVGAR